MSVSVGSMSGVVGTAAAAGGASSSQTLATANVQHQPSTAVNTAASTNAGSAPSNSSSASSSSSSGSSSSSSSSSSTAATPSFDFVVPNSTSPLIQHGAFSLSGIDCINVSKIIDLLARCGFTPNNDARFGSLVALWTFIHRFHRNSLTQKIALAQQSKHAEPALMNRTGLFSGVMHKQLLLQIKCANLLWIDPVLVSQNPSLITQKELPQPMLEVLRSFTKANAIHSLNSILDPAIQASILKERQVMIQSQLIAASNGRITADQVNAATASGAAFPFTNDQGVAFFVTSSPHSLSYPPNQKQLDQIPDLVGPKFMNTDPCTLATDFLFGPQAPAPVMDVITLKKERDRLVRLELQNRKEELDEKLMEIRDSAPEEVQRSTGIAFSTSNNSLLTLSRGAFNREADLHAPSNKPPMWMEIDSLALGLVGLQRKIRHKILSAIPSEAIISGTYRTRREIENSQRAREKEEKKNRLLAEKHLKKTRKNFLNAVTNHCRDFQTFHRELQKKVYKNICAAVLKYFDDREKRKQDYEKAQEKARLTALKDNNEEAYVALLKEAKNERLLNLLKQTDAYMDQLSRQIAHEQAELALKGQDDGANNTKNKWSKPNAEMEALMQETPEQADRRRMQRLEAEERKAQEMVKMEDEKAAEIKSEIPDAAGQTPSARKMYYSLAHKRQEEIVEQPMMLKGGKLRSYQMEGLQWLVSLYNNQLNGILADEMGLGKTVQSLSLLAYLMEVKHNYGPFLIIVPMSTLHNNWEFECDRWLPGISKVVYDGDKDRRRYLKDNFIKPGHFNIVMTTFEFAMRDKAVLRKIPWQYIIIDEAHRLKNPACKLAQELATYPKESRRIALTGTPLQNELHELWSLLNFLHPSIFNSSDSFEKWFSTPFDKMPVGAQDREKHQAMNEEERLLIINRLHSILRPFMLRREKSSVESDLADKIEKVLRCELTPVQKAMYGAVLEGKVSVHNKVMQLRKICNTPLLFHPFMRSKAGADHYTPDENLVRMCGKFTLLDQILFKLKRTGHRVLIFNQMTKVMDVLEDYCRMRQFTFLRLDGSTSAESRTESLQKFNAPDSPYFLFMLSTKAGGLGLNLQSADTVILFDSDWNPQNDAQAMARAHRLGQSKQVIVLRFITTATVEEKVLSTATTKLSHEQMVIQAGMFHTKYSHNASRQIATDAMAKERQLEIGDTGDDEDESWTDDFISRTLARSDSELTIFQEMDAVAKRSEQQGNVTRGMPEGKMPKWCWDWCIRGSGASSLEQGLVPFNEKLLDAARDKTMKVDGPSANVADIKSRAHRAAIVEVSDSDDDRNDVVAEASGVNDAALDDEEERPLNYDELDEEENYAPLPQHSHAEASPFQQAHQIMHLQQQQQMPTPRPSPSPPLPIANDENQDMMDVQDTSKSMLSASPSPAASPSPLGYDQSSSSLAPSPLGSPSAVPASFATPAAAAGKKKASQGKRKRDDNPLNPDGTPASATPATKKKKAAATDGSTKKSSKKKANIGASPAAVAAADDSHEALTYPDDDDFYQPLSYSSDEDDADAGYGGGTSIAATSSSGFKLVIRGAGTPATIKKATKK